MTSQRRYGLIGGACGLGLHKPETQQGPRAFRTTGILGRLQGLGVDVKDYGDVAEPAQGLAGPDLGLRHGAQIQAFSAQFHSQVKQIVLDDRVPVVMGGDHSIAAASVAAVVQGLSERAGRPVEVGLLWIDAHGDVNTPETTTSGNAHGMPVAALCGFGHEILKNIGGTGPRIDPRLVTFVGLRELDPPEKTFIKKHNLKAYTMADIDAEGIGPVMRRVLDGLSKCRDGFVVSFDLDACDPAVAPGVGTPVPGGLSYREAHLIMEMVAQAPGLRSVELVEYNPTSDTKDMTAQFGIGLLESALGKSIL